ncbi:MAG: hypothetical protein K2X04_11015 [Burkholderiales bacterium]|nr:hypothetical protein [Burkholderiales bacterium]
MFKQNSMYYLWHNQFSTLERKIIATFLFQTLVEYAIFFVLLAHHHAVAMIVFQTSDWFPSTLYFDILFSAILAICFITFLLILRYQYVIHPASIVGMSTCYAQVFYLIFLTLGLGFLKHYDLSVLVIFILISAIFAIGYAYDKIITIGSLLSIINNRSAYLFLVQCYFFALSSGLIFASILNKLATVVITHYIFSISPLVLLLLFASIIAAFSSHSLAKFKPVLDAKKMQEIYKSLFSCKKELFARLGINIVIGAFLVKWYFTMPLFLQYSENWNAKHIANAIFIAASLSLVANWFFLRWFNKFDAHRLFNWIIAVLAVTVLFVAANLYFHHWVLFCVILMAVFYNSLQSTVNKIVHYDIITIEINLILLIIGGLVSLILFAFIVSGLSVFLSKQVGIHSQALAMPILLLTFILIGIYSFYRLKHHRKQRVELEEERNA